MSLEQITLTVLDSNAILGYNGGVAGLSWPHPALTDINADGDYDLFVGTADGRISFFENQGNPVQAQFVFISAFYGDIDVGNSAAPCFYDINCDGDLDLFIGNGTNGGHGGNVRYFENTGSPDFATWVMREDSLAGLDAHDFSVPTLGDLDNDGDADLIVGGGYGALFFAKNIGTCDSAIWATPIANYGNIFSGYKATPHLADFDCDGKPDLIIGNDTGKLFFRKNIGVDATGAVQWQLLTNTLTGVDFTHLDYTAPACADLDADGDLDVLLSEHFGNINYFENIGGLCITNQWNWVTGDLLSGTIDVGQSAYPTLVDIDGDCDNDIFIGKANGQIRFYRNDGTPDQANWVLVTEKFLGFDTGGTGLNPAKPVFTDFDSDGDYDLVIASSDFWYYENFGSANSFDFQLVSNNFLPGNLHYSQSPVFADFNGDSLTDYAMPQYANGSQSIFIYLNSGQAVSPWPLQASDTISAGPYFGYFFQALDYDYDGDPDFIFFNFSGSPSTFLLRNNGVEWSLEMLLNYTPSNQQSSLFWTDFDHDFDWDLFAGTANGGILFWENISNWAKPNFSWLANFLSVQFTDSSSQASEWHWDFGDGHTYHGQNPSHSFVAPGEYIVCLTIENSCRESTLCQNVSVCASPVPDFEITVQLSTAVFSNLSTWATEYFWEFGDGQTSTEENPTHTYGSDGHYAISLTAINACDTVTKTHSVIIVTSPVAQFFAQNTLGCTPFSVQFFNQSSPNTNVLFWSFPGGTPITSTESNPVVVYHTSGVFDATLVACNALTCDTLNQAGFILANHLPAAGFSFTSNMGTVSFVNNSIGAASYKWDFGDGETSTEPSPTYTYLTPGEYEVTLTATNDCGSAAFTQTVSVMLTGVESQLKFNDFVVFPNPGDGKFNLILQGEPIALLEIFVVDVLGKKHFHEVADFRKGFLFKPLYLNYLPSGVYWLSVLASGKICSQKMVKM